MAKKASGKQTTLNSFFKGGKAAEPDDAPASDADMDVDADNDAEVDVEVEADASNKKDGKIAPDDSSDPPISDIPAIFSDIVRRIPEIVDIAKHVKGRKLRVATMCSGTESPLLAFGLIQRAIREQHGIELEMEHVFSCEIVPFKQAYIERNFSPPLLFRDVCELGNDFAHTAYGSLVPVPGDVDILVAGTSCVDYSNLNNEKKDIDDGGESGRTFHGMLQWVQKHRPPIVILENVCSAPWQLVEKKFEKINYSAKSTRLDTKLYYIPHTRTRGYMVAVNKANSSIPEKWVKAMISYRREASASLDAFLLASDDPRIHQAREKLVQESYNGQDRKTGRTDWGRCESRHQRARLEEALGPKRPLTNWDEGGACKMLDFGWADWTQSQVERVKDLMDISTLRAAKDGIDPSFKSGVWNLSQNVDRTIGSNRVGICPCLTPSMIAYITNRGGPMVGVEALGMQGLPHEGLLLTRETEDQLADLAGNAMSTTVVGTAMLAALILGKKLLKDGDDRQTYEEHNGTNVDVEQTSDAMDVDVPTDVSVEDHISREDQLAEKPLDLLKTTERSLPLILEDALKSARLCACEGRKDITERQLMRCKDCGATSCVKCGGRPEHNYEVIDVTTNPRLSPSSFALDLKSLLPMSLSFSAVTLQLLNKLKDQAAAAIPDQRWTAWSTAVFEATQLELRFVELKRQDMWIATYESPKGRLELYLHPKRPEWLFFAKPDPMEPANAEIRRILMYPACRLVCDGALLAGQLEFALPHTTEVSVKVKGVGELVGSWEAKLGLLGEYAEKRVYSQLQVTVEDADVSLFDRDISGTYTLFDKCGTACNALHKKDPVDSDADQPPLFLMMDPTRCGKPADDFFVFATTIRRFEYGETRPIVGRFASSWRQSDKADEESVRCFIPQKYVPAVDVQLQSSTGLQAQYAVPQGNLDIEISNDACQTANALLVVRIPLGDQAGAEWPRAWKEVEPIEERATFRMLSWLTERVKNIDGAFSDWKVVAVPDSHVNCERCAPHAPSLQWTKVGNKIMAFEDSHQAGEYERRLKGRPSPFVTQLKLDDNAVGVLRIGLNVSSLIHRARSRLPSRGSGMTQTVSWRLDTDFKPLVKLILPKFKLSSNRNDPEHPQPPHFILDLRPEQQRSLHWMLAQEEDDAPPFVEEEISEAILEPLNWRAEGRAQQSVHVRGGVLADQVGYGKTAITLGLIDCAMKEVKKRVKAENAKGPMFGKIRTSATLVVVPGHLTKQWASEVQKFMGKGKLEVVVLSSVANINTLTVQAVMDADIIIIASTLLKSPIYLENLEAFAAGGSLPKTEGRYLNARLDESLSALAEQVERLRDPARGPAAVMDAILEARKKDRETQEAMQPSKRIKGIARTVDANASSKTASTPKAMVSSSKATASSSKVEVKTTDNTKVTATGPLPSAARFSHIEVPTLAEARKAAKSKTAESSEKDDASDSDSPPPRKRRASAKVINYVASDSDDDVPVKTKKRKTGASTSRSVSPDAFVPTDDDDGDVPEDSEAVSDEEDDFEPEDEDSDAPKSKAKGKAKAKATPKRPPPKAKPKKGKVTDDDDDAMDVDASSSAAETTSSAAGKKRKRETKETKPKELRETKDPWKLKGKAKKDWKEMQAPPLEMFHFARLVVDEYTYLHKMPVAMTLVARQSADRRWVLSGTPPVHDFAAVKTIAAFLDVHLGIDDDGESQSKEVKKRLRDQTAAEKFHSFRETHSLNWHAHRHNMIGQTFLDRFVRQNIAEIDEIPWETKETSCTLPAAERAIYLELEHHLQALDMNIKRGKKSEGDRDKRLAKALGTSETAHEALLKHCAHFELETSSKNAMKACDIIVQQRKAQQQECEKDLRECLKKALTQEKDLGPVPEESAFREYVRVCRTKGIDDREATDIVVALLDEANVGTSTVKSKPKGGKDEPLSEKKREAIWAHREHTHVIRRVTKELVARVRSHRYFTVVRDFQKQREKPLVISCPMCNNDRVPVEEIAVLSTCGHAGCLSCVTKCAEQEACVYAAQGDCGSPARLLNIVRGSTLGVDDEDRDGKGKHYGRKLEEVIVLIRSILKKKERVLVFIQFEDLMKKVGEALKDHSIEFLEIKGSASQKSKNLEAFQNLGKEKVLLLSLAEETASGANLTCANHAIFLSPLLAPTQEVYDATMTQAIGRLRRFGQKEKVLIYHYLAENTIDMEVYTERTRNKVPGQ